MKIIRIRLKNIHSLAGEHVIDFSKPPLSNTGLFAIVGPTGAGKSTILDVITLALFDNTSRFGKQLSFAQLRNTGGIITRGRNNALAEVTYQINDKTFTSRWTAGKNNKQMVLLDQNENVLAAGIKDVKNMNEKNIGLNYEQFIRAVILPQGQFANFLKADSDERIEILEKITGTEIYRDISKKAYEKAKYYKNLVDQEKKLLDQITVLSNTQIQDIKEHLLSLDERSAFVQKNIAYTDQLISIKEKIQTLKNKLAETDEQTKQLNQQIQNFKPQIQRLELHKKLLPYTSKITQWQNLKQNIAQKNNQLLTVQNQLAKLSKLLQNIETQITQITEQIQNKDQFYKSALPIIKQLRSINADIQTLNSLYHNTEALNQQINAKIQSTQKQIAKIQEQITSLQAQIQDINHWLEQNQILESLSAELAKIFSDFDLYADKFKEISNFITKNLKSFANQFNIKDPENAKNNALKLTQTLQNQINTLKEQLPWPDATQSQINQKLSNINAQLNVLFQTKTAFENINTLQKQLHTLEQQRSETNNSLYEHKKQLQQYQKLIEVRKNNVEIAKRQLENERIAQSSAFIRQKLSDGQTCPVCGNIFNHATAPALSQNSIQLLEQQLNNEQQLLEQALKEHAQISATIKSLEKNLKQIDSQIHSLNQNISQTHEHIRSLLNQQNITIHTITLNSILDYLNNLQKQQQKLQNSLEIAEKIDKLSLTLDALSTLTTYLTQLQKIKQNISQSLQKYSDYDLQNLSVNQIKQKLSQLSQTWKLKTQQLQELSSSLNSLKTSLNEKNTYLKDLNQQLTQNQQKLKNLELELNQLRTKYNQLATKIDLKPEQDIDSFEQHLTDQIENLKKQLSTLQSQYAGTKSQIVENNKLIASLQNEIHDYQQQLRILSASLTQTFKEIGIESIDQAVQNLLPEDQAQAIEQQYMQMREQFQALVNKTIELQNELKQLEQLDNPKINLDQLKQSLDKLSSIHNLIQQKIGSLNQELKIDAKNRQLRQTQLEKFQQIQQEFKRWDLLNTLIGSQDGDKFQRIVQEYNFMLLVDQANLHLKRFAPRYALTYKKDKINKKDIFELFVVDNDMAGELRSVKTLSGGETFLVSLALALALSSLASYKTSIANLFIDEGFGSLDANTLDMALSTLEKLQLETNRKIGIISHVEQLKERIPVKIEVRKMAGGISKIFITQL